MKNTAKFTTLGLEVLAAEALFTLGETKAAVDAYIRILTDDSYNMMDRK